MSEISQILGYKKIFSIFPELYNFREFSPFILRITVAVIFMNMGWRDITKKTGWKIINFILGITKIATGIFLLVALYTQVAALFAIVLSLFKILSDLKSGEYKYNLGYHTLILVVSLSLLLTGPGTFSIDLPL